MKAVGNSISEVDTASCSGLTAPVTKVNGLMMNVIMESKP